MTLDDRNRAAVPVFIALAAGLSGCGSGEGDDTMSGERCSASLLTGDVVISEVFANPAGEDEGKEWFELYNATSKTVDLETVRLVAGSGADAVRHTVGSLEIEPGSYAVVGGVLPEFQPEHVDYGYGSDLGALTNGGGDLALECDGTEIDAATYPEMENGVAHGLDGAITPDYNANDTPTTWCAATKSYGDDALGSPGASNESCGAVVQETCQGEGGEREVVAPQAGDLVITEIMANPDAVDDEVGEWFEVYVNRDVDINNLQLGYVELPDAEEPGPGPVEQTIGAVECLRATAGSHLVFALSDDSSQNGGIPVVDYLFDFGRYDLTNSDKGLYIGLGGEVLDAVTYGGTDAGQSLALHPDKRSAEDNDTQRFWCTSETAYGTEPGGVDAGMLDLDAGMPEGDKGTPGAANPACEIELPPVPEGMCRDADGNVREIVPPTDGSIHVVEFMASPTSSDSSREWIELLVDEDADLNGLELRTTLDDTSAPSIVEPDSGECLHVPAGGRGVLSRGGTDPATNGGVEGVLAEVDFSLSNSSEDGIFIGLDGMIFDQVTFSCADEGISRIVEPDSGDQCDADPFDSYNGGDDFGTPGAANPTCSSGPACEQ